MITINLLPVREERRRASLMQLVAMMAASLVVSVALSALFHWSISSDVDTARTAAKQTQSQIDQFGPQLKQVEEYKTVKADIERKLDVIDQLSDARSGPVHIFDQISNQIPERVWVTQIQIENGSMRLKGMSLDNELVALFLTGLEESPYFKGVELVQTEARERDGFKLNQFEVSATLTSPAAERRAEDQTSQAAATATGTPLALASN